MQERRFFPPSSFEGNEERLRIEGCSFCLEANEGRRFKDGFHGLSIQEEEGRRVDDKQMDDKMVEGKQEGGGGERMRQEGIKETSVVPGDSTPCPAKNLHLLI